MLKTVEVAAAITSACDAGSGGGGRCGWVPDGGADGDGGHHRGKGCTDAPA
jgi:hypothetical protein